MNYFCRSISSRITGLEEVLHKLKFPGVLGYSKNFKPVHFHFYDNLENNYDKHILYHLKDHLITKYSWPLNNVGVRAPTPHVVEIPNINFDSQLSLGIFGGLVQVPTPHIPLCGYHNPRMLKALIQNDAEPCIKLTLSICRFSTMDSNIVFDPWLMESVVDSVYGCETRRYRGPTAYLLKKS